MSMGSQEELAWAAVVLALLLQGISASGKTTSDNGVIAISQKGKNVSLVCKDGNNATRWSKDGRSLSFQGEELVLAVMDDPRGTYKCISNSNRSSRPMQVFIRMCQNCVHLDLATILGVSAASLIATAFLAIAVYHIGLEERGWPAQASDKQCLLANEQLYQPLQEHSDRPYSHVGIAKTRRR
ncbi:T-cell surface glycoprotein CD3 gamma chain-like isoform X2 [Erythrolamprus reginae]|uniref:T-cell surface glycoprotein CD3 gamma chain-like isoform X2 n=1 Tax=Erythrolamprus reginae TaxID=121349 RepID=UPI00396C36C1